jgi:hypothetical protein
VLVLENLGVSTQQRARYCCNFFVPSVRPSHPRCVSIARTTTSTRTIPNFEIWGLAAS